MFEVFTLPLTPFAQNTRVLIWRGIAQAVVLDPGGEADEILGFLKQQGAELREIWLTHSHLDHCGGAARLMRETGAELLGHPDEADFRANVETVCGMYGIPAAACGMENCPEPGRLLRGGETISFGGDSFSVIYTPGHSPGHVCFYHKESSTLFCGDTVFQGSIGRTDLPGGDHGTLIKSIREKILTLPPQTKLLSGHTADTTVAIESKTNPFLAG